MMNEAIKEYAEALFRLARENAAEKEYNDALLTVEDVVSKNPDYIAVLSSEVIDFRERERLIDGAFGNFLPEYVTDFLKIILKNGRISEIKECIAEYVKLYNAFSKEGTARIVSAVALTQEERRRVVKKTETLTGKRISAEFEIDEKILGGIIVYTEDCVFDGSVKTKLRELKEVTEK